MSKITDEYIQVTDDPRQIDGSTADITAETAVASTLKARSIVAKTGGTLTITAPILTDATYTAMTATGPVFTNAVLNGTITGAIINTSTDHTQALGIGEGATAAADYNIQLGEDATQATGTLKYRDQIVSNMAWGDSKLGLAEIDTSGNLGKVLGFKPPIETVTFTTDVAVADIDSDVTTTIFDESGDAILVNTSATLYGLNDNAADRGKVKFLAVKALSAGIKIIVTIDADTDLKNSSGASIASMEFSSAGQSAQLMWLGTFWIVLGTGATLIAA